MSVDQRADGLENGGGAGRGAFRKRVGSVPVALVMLKAGVDKPEAVRRLARAEGNVRRAIEDTVMDV